MGIIAEQWNVDDCVQLAVQRATGLDRLRGLLARPQLEPGQALMIPHCRSVHSYGMRHAIDVIFVAATGTVLRVQTLEPGRRVACHAATHTFELRAEQALQLGIARGSRFTRQTNTAEEASQ